MKLSELYEKGEAFIRQKDYGFVLDGVETEFILKHDRKILDSYTFRQHAIDAPRAGTGCTVLNVPFKTPIIMSAMTMPIPAMADDGLMQVALGLKDAGSLMWTGTPVPQNLNELVQTGVPLAANVKPLSDRRKMFDQIDEIQAAGVHWVGIEIDSGQGTKIRDQLVAGDCTPLSLLELEEIRRKVKGPLIFKGILSPGDAKKSVDAGADGIMISNHGAHTLDYLPHPFQVIDSIVAAVKGKTVIMVDGGFRRGSDVLKGLAFGAQLVGLGRPVIFGLAADGRDGVKGVIQGITQELVRLMSMVGIARPWDARRDMLIPEGP